jgi:asparagine synthase (glutamine-hydrolysing)
MCGVFAKVSLHEQLNFSHDQKSIVADRLSHRGPDQLGEFIDDNIWLSNYRLAIVGGESNTQPISNIDRTVIISFNGEIYNYLELRKSLSNAGVIFKENGDTPVLLHAYLLWGVEFVSKIDGQFAIIIYDKRLNRIFAFRDRFGEKPLYFSENNKEVTISSEVTPIVDISKKNYININALFDLLLVGYIQDPESIYTHINAIPAGHFLTVSYEKIYLSLWDLRKIPNSKSSNSKEITKNLITEAIKTSITERIPQEVDSALLLSGGIDSTLLAILAKEMGYNLNHLTTSFSDSKYDESDIVKKITSRYKLKSTLIEMSPPSLEDLIEISKKIDEPIAEPSFFAAYKLGRVAKLNNYKVIINGDGADELFGGYPTYQADLIDKNLGIYLRPVTKQILKFGKFIPNGEKVFGNRELLNRFSSLKYESDIKTHFAWRFNFRYELLENIFPGINRFTPSKYDAFRLIEKQHRFHETINSMMYIDQYSWLTSGHLRKADRAFMLNSVESRSPFLANQIVSISDHLSTFQKVDIFQTKKVLRSILEDYVSKDISRAKKKGWTMPIDRWLESTPNTLLEPIKDGVFFKTFMTGDAIKNLIHSKNKYSMDNYRILWSMLMIETWLSTHSWSLQ